MESSRKGSHSKMNRRNRKRMRTKMLKRSNRSSPSDQNRRKMILRLSPQTLTKTTLSSRGSVMITRKSPRNKTLTLRKTISHKTITTMSQVKMKRNRLRAAQEPLTNTTVKRKKVLMVTVAISDQPTFSVPLFPPHYFIHSLH